MLRIYTGPVDTTTLTLSDTKAIAGSIWHDTGKNIIWLSSIYDNNETSEKYEILEFLIQGFTKIYKNFFGPSCTNYPFVEKILQNDDLYMFDMLVRYGYPINGSNKDFTCLTRRPIEIAISYGYVDIFDYLVNKGARIKYYNIMLAVRKNQYDIFVRLLEKNIHLTTGENIIYDCIQELKNPNILPFLEKLIAIGFDANIPPENNGLAALVPLFVNTENAHSVLELLLRAGADVNSYNYNDEYGRTLLSELLQRHYIPNTGPSIDLLLANGAKIRMTDYHSDNIRILRRNYPLIFQKYAGKAA